MANKRIEVEIVGDTKQLERAFGRAKTASTGLERGFHGLNRAAGAAIGLGVGAGLVGVGLAAHTAWKELEQSQKAAAQTGAVLKSTGGAANVTAKHVDALAGALLKKSGIDDETVKSGENMLLTFTKIRNETGKGNDVFDRATRAVLDMNVAMTQGNVTQESLAKQSILVGKALNDPVKGMTALRRVGVTFSQDQVNLIKHLEETGHHLEAQRFILRELNKEFGGSAEALGKTLPGRLSFLRESLKNMAAGILEQALPALNRLTTFATTTGLPALQRFIAGIDFHAVADGVKAPVETVIGALKSMIGTVGDVRNFLGPDLFAGLIVGIAGAGGALDAIVSLRKALTALGALGVGTGPLAIGFAALALTIGGLATIFLHNRSAADTVSEAYRRAADAARGLRDAQESLKQSELNVQQAHLRQKQATDTVRDAEVNYSNAVREFGPKAQQTIEALHTLQGARLQSKQAALDAATAEKAHAQAQDKTATAARNTSESIVQAAHRQRDYQSSLGAVAGALGGVTRGLSRNSAFYQDTREKADRFADAMDRAAAHTRKLNPAVSTAQRAVGNLARALESIPSDTTIRFIVKTLSFTPGASPRGGAFQGGGHAAGGRIGGARTMADSVPAMLSPGEFVVTGGGEQMLENMTFPGVLNWLQTKQPRHFAAGGRAGTATKNIEYDRMYQAPMGGGIGGGAVSTSGLVPQVLRALSWARSHGWRGSVTSGFRTYATQAGLYARYLAGGPLAARPGTSSHEFGQAVDVSDYGTFGATMSSAPPGSRLYNRLGAADPVHYSVSGYRAGGRAKKKRPYRGDPFTSSRPGPGSPAKLRRPRILDDPSIFPLSIQEGIADADLTEPTTDDIVAYMRAEQFLNKRLQSKLYSGNPAARIKLKQALKSVRDTIKSLKEQAGEDTSADTGPTPDQQAQLDQLRAQVDVANRSASLANAFVSTGVFASQAGGPIGAGGGIYVFPSVFPPTAEQVRQAGGIVAQAAGEQGFRVASSVSLGV